MYKVRKSTAKTRRNLDWEREEKALKKFKKETARVQPFMSLEVQKKTFVKFSKMGASYIIKSEPVLFSMFLETNAEFLFPSKACFKARQ